MVVRPAPVGPVQQGRTRQGCCSSSDLHHRTLLIDAEELRQDHAKCRDLRNGECAQIEAVVDAVERGFRFRPLLRVVVSDASRATLTLRFFLFSQSQAEGFLPGLRLCIYGEVREGAAGLEIVHPLYQRVQPDTPLEVALTPVYPATEGIGQTTLVRLAKLALAALPDDAELDVLPEALRCSVHLPSLGTALRTVHAPPGEADITALMARTHPAQRRLAFDELLAHQIGMRKLRRHLRALPAPTIRHDQARRRSFLAALPFALTDAQQRVLGEIDQDLAIGRPMLRLVQGDVGSGKTVVAALAALAALAGARRTDDGSDWSGQMQQTRQMTTERGRASHRGGEAQE